MDDYRAEGCGDGRRKQLGDVVQSGGPRDARTAEFEHKPFFSFVWQGRRHVILSPRGLTRAVSLKRLFVIVLEYIAQFLFQLAFRQDVLDPAPRRLAAFARRHCFRAPLRALYEGIKIVRFLGFPEKFIVNIEMFVFAFAHFWRKAPEINSIDQLKFVKLRTISDSARHSTSATRFTKVLDHKVFVQFWS